MTPETREISVKREEGGGLRKYVAYKERVKREGRLESGRYKERYPRCAVCTAFHCDSIVPRISFADARKESRGIRAYIRPCSFATSIYRAHFRLFPLCDTVDSTPSSRIGFLGGDIEYRAPRSV